MAGLSPCCSLKQAELLMPGAGTVHSITPEQRTRSGAWYGGAGRCSAAAQGKGSKQGLRSQPAWARMLPLGERRNLPVPQGLPYRAG